MAQLQLSKMASPPAGQGMEGLFAKILMPITDPHLCSPGGYIFKTMSTGR